MIKWLHRLKDSWRSAFGCAATCAIIGTLLIAWNNPLLLLSYDLLFRFRGTVAVDDVWIVYLDDHSFNKLGQSTAQAWDRKLHAILLNRLTDAGVRLVVFDIVFNLPGTSEANADLVRAIRRNGKVVLAAAIHTQVRAQIEAKEPVMPLPEFREAAAGWGIAQINSPEDEIAREYFRGSETLPSLPWVAASLMGAKSTQQPEDSLPQTLINYYGGSTSLKHMSFAEALGEPSETFRNKVVFVGARPKTLKAQDETDEFRTPYSRWRGDLFPGVEITATRFLNLVRDEGFTRIDFAKEMSIVTGVGLLIGAVMVLLRPLHATVAAILTAVAILAIGLQFARHHTWFGWTIVAFAQIPCALVWSIRSHVQALKFDKEVLQRTLEEASRLFEATKTAAAAVAKNSGLVIPDHTLVRRVGKGAYGEVWLARNAVGVYHAVKIMQRRLFPADEPYEREFRGIQKFMPISRTHPGLVHILHVGRNDEEKFFFCIMEAGDDETTGQQIDPDKYTPKSLGSEIERLGQIPPEECLRLGLALTDALAHLHTQKLIHRDIKPPNIIFVSGAPKFADIGLVTDLAGQGEDVSYLGTEGYIAPEGPGTASADVYSLGKVLYEASMGRDRRLFPEVPTAILEQPRTALVRRLNEIIFKACESEVELRYKTALEMHADLLRLQKSL